MKFTLKILRRTNKYKNVVNEDVGVILNGVTYTICAIIVDNMMNWNKNNVCVARQCSGYGNGLTITKS